MKPDSPVRVPSKRAHPRPGRLRRRLVLGLGLLVLGTALYGAAGVFGVPWLIQRWLNDYQAGAPARAARVASVAFDPFALVARIDGLEIRNAATGTRFAAERIALDLSATSLVERRPVISSMVISAPALAVAAPGELPGLGRRLRTALPGAVRIERLEVTDGTLTAGDEADPALALASFGFTLAELDTGGDSAGRFRLEGTTANATRILSFGALGPDLETANGELELAGAELAALAPWLGSVVTAARPAGRIGVTARLDASGLLSAPAVALDGAALEIVGLSLTPAAGLTVTSAAIGGTGALRFGAGGSALSVSGRVEIDAAALTIRDAVATPAQSFSLPNAAILIAADAAGDGLTVNLGGPLDAAGDLSLTVRVPATATEANRVAIRATDLPAPVLSAYAASALGRSVIAGRADVETEYAASGERVDGRLRLSARGLEFAELPRTALDDAGGERALELAAALLEDSAGVVELELPFAGVALRTRDAAAAALRARLAALTATPFEALAPLLAGGPGAASAVPFQPGDAALNDRALATIEQLAAALAERPRLGLRVHSGYDARADRDALARQQIQLHVQLATAGSSDAARAVDFRSPRAQDVLDEFAGERLPPGRVAELKSRFECEGAMIPLCQRAYYELIFDALVENEQIAPTTLSRLARFRAASVTDALTRQGVAADRLEVVADGTVVDSPFGVGLRVELTAAGSP